MLNEHALASGKAIDLTPMDFLIRAIRERRVFLHQSFAQAGSGDAPLDIERLHIFVSTRIDPETLQECELRSLVKGSRDKHGSKWSDHYTDPVAGKILDPSLVRDMASEGEPRLPAWPCDQNLRSLANTCVANCQLFGLTRCTGE